jgi:homoserine kinase
LADEIRIRVPGSTSNLGSGFDALSAALSVYLRVNARATGGTDLVWPDDWTLEPDENAIEIGLRRACAELGAAVPGLTLSVESEIPLRRGLGSSGAAFVAGIRLAESLTGQSLPQGEALRLAYELEGHPDNVAASLLGGWVLSCTEGSRLTAERIPSRLACRFVVAIPEMTISTSEARAILPKSYDLTDSVFSLQRCGLMVLAISQGRGDLLAEATRDRLHQPFRAKLIPGAQAVLERRSLPDRLQGSVLSVTISGSGSTLLAIARDDFQQVGHWMTDVLGEAGVRSEFRVLDLDLDGARIS